MNKEKSEKLGKDLEATPAELEFIYSRLDRKSTEDIIDDLINYHFPVRSPGFIKRRLREFTVAKKVIAKQAEGAYDTDRIERRKRHWNRLSERAQELLNHLKTYFPYVEEYTIAEVAVDNDDFECINLLTDFRTKCLFSHMKAELSELENLRSWEDLKINNITNRLLDTLGRQAERQQFVGKCEVCKDWD